MARLSVARRGLDSENSASAARSALLDTIAGGVFLDFKTGTPGLPFSLREPPSLTQPDLIILTTPATTSAAMTYEGTIVPSSIGAALKIVTNGVAYAYFTLNSIGRLAYTTFGRMYVNVPTFTVNWRPVWWYSTDPTGNALPAGAMRVGSDGHVNVLSGGGAPSVVGTSNITLSAGQWYRIEWGVTRETAAGAANGIATVQIFAGDSPIPLDTFASSGFASGTHLDLIQAGSANNSNFAGNPVYFAGYADGCRFPPGPYSSGWAFAVGDGTVSGGFTETGDFVLPMREALIGNNHSILYRPGEQAFKVSAKGPILAGPSRNLIESDPNDSIADFVWTPTDGRVQTRSINVDEHADSPDITLRRYANVANPSGTDGSWNGTVSTPGTIFTVPSMGSTPTIPAIRQPYGGFQSVHRGMNLTINGGVFFIDQVLNSTQVKLLSLNGDPATTNPPTAYGLGVAASTTVAAGSNGVNVNTFIGTQTLNVASTTGFASNGRLSVATGSGTAIIAYTSTTSTTFQNCTLITGAQGGVASGTMSTGGAVAFVWTWTIALTPYWPIKLPGGGALGQLPRTAPGCRQYVRSGGGATASISANTKTLTDTAAPFTAMDATRLICLNGDLGTVSGGQVTEPPRVYKISQVLSTTSVLLDHADNVDGTRPTTNITWDIAGGDYEDTLQTNFNPCSLGMENFSGYVANFAADGSKGFCPVDFIFSLAGNAFYSGGGNQFTPPTMAYMRGVTGNFEPVYRISFGDPRLSTSGNEVTDTQVYRSSDAVNPLVSIREAHTQLVDATVLGVATKVKAGAPVDGDWASGAPPVGTIVLDTTNSKLWVRTGVATWKGVVVA